MRRILQIFGLILFSLINVKAKIPGNSNGSNRSVQASSSTNLFWNSTNFSAAYAIYNRGSVNSSHRASGASCRYAKASSALKVRLSSIKATNEGSCNRIDWKIESEAANASCTIERINGLRNYVVINTIYSKGTPYLYNFKDVTPENQISYYRLKMADAYGIASYSKVVNATTKATSNLTIAAYPSPVSEILTVNIKGTQGHNSQIVTTNIAGKFIRRLKFLDYP